MIGMMKAARGRDTSRSSSSSKRSSGSSENTSRSRKDGKDKKGDAKKGEKKGKRKRKRSSSSCSSASQSRATSRHRSCDQNVNADAAKTGTVGSTDGGAALTQKGESSDSEELKKAKMDVLAKLTGLQKVEPKEDRLKQFRSLLRDWHPDKNPENTDVATAVFQFLQKGKPLINV